MRLRPVITEVAVVLLSEPTKIVYCHASASIRHRLEHRLGVSFRTRNGPDHWGTHCLFGLMVVPLTGVERIRRLQEPEITALIGLGHLLHVQTSVAALRNGR